LVSLIQLNSTVGISDSVKVIEQELTENRQEMLFSSQDLYYPHFFSNIYSNMLPSVFLANESVIGGVG
jgi:hypothetical protein